MPDNFLHDFFWSSEVGPATRRSRTGNPTLVLYLSALLDWNKMLTEDEYMWNVSLTILLSIYHLFINQSISQSICFSFVQDGPNSTMWLERYSGKSPERILGERIFLNSLHFLGFSFSLIDCCSRCLLSPFNSPVLMVAVQRATGHLEGNLALTRRAMEDGRMVGVSSAMSGMALPARTAHAKA